ncbi:MAG: hypothetical protein IKT53_06515, partial [Bacteroidaceae bacterium]|nr:hypothetical protein [Bacteroidaceae bacterium]
MVIAVVAAPLSWGFEMAIKNVFEMHKIFSFKGITRGCDNLLASDGECIMAVNVRAKDGVMVPLPQPTEEAVLTSGYSKIFWHDMTRHYLCVTDDAQASLHLYDSSWNRVLDESGEPFAFDGLYGVNKVEFLGYVACCMCRSGIVYVIYRDGKYCSPLVGLLLVLSAIGHYTHERSVRRNFSFVSYPGDKYAAAVIEDENALQEIGRRAVSEGDATVAYFRRTGFLTDYLTNAYDDDCGDDWSRWMTPTAFGLSVVLSLLALMSEHVSGTLEWMSVFTGMICLSM